jgi:ABC-type microcin C transport system permease subunit YejE
MGIVLGTVWSFWIAPLLVVSVVLILLTMIGVYLKKVVAPRYPKR